MVVVMQDEMRDQNRRQGRMYESAGQSSTEAGVVQPRRRQRRRSRSEKQPWNVEEEAGVLTVDRLST
jgi:hypothetical protein